MAETSPGDSRSRTYRVQLFTLWLVSKKLLPAALRESEQGDDGIEGQGSRVAQGEAAETDTFCLQGDAIQSGTAGESDSRERRPS